MPQPTPNLGDVAGRAASVLEAGLPGIDARSQNAPAAVYARMSEVAAWDLYFYLSYLALEMMPDTAQDLLDRHAATWGITRVGASAAIGNALAQAGAAAVTVPQYTLLVAPGGAQFQTTAAVTIPAGTSGSVPVASMATGSSQSQAAGTLLTPVAVISGLNPQTMTVDNNGLVGEDAEIDGALRARLLARIRQRPAGGAWGDYIEWCKEALSGVQYVGVLPAGAGQGTVTIYIAMSENGTPVAATPAQVATVQSYIGSFNADPGVRPVTANVTVMAATLTAVNVSLQVRPNTAATQAAAQQALALAFAQDATVGGSIQASGTTGGTIYVSRLDDAVASSDGEYSHERLAPAADVVVATGQLPVLGAVTFS